MLGHPDSDFKRISLGDIVNFTWGPELSPSAFQAVRWRLGTTEAGSSDSPVLGSRDDGHRVAGILSGGNHRSLDQDSLWGPFCNPDLCTGRTRLHAVFRQIQPSLDVTGAPPPAPTAPVGLGHGQIIELSRGEDGKWRGDTVLWP